MLNSGVTVIDPQHTYVSPDAQIGRDTTLHPNVHVEGRTVIGEGCEMMQGSRIADSRVGNGVTVKDHCVIVDSEVADHCVVGPFAHLRMNARMEESARGRQLRRDEEVSARLEVEGEPPHLPRRRGRRRAHQHRRRHHHLQLRREEQAPDRHRARRQDRLRHDAGRARPRRRALGDGRRLGRHRGRRRPTRSSRASPPGSRRSCPARRRRTRPRRRARATTRRSRSRWPPATRAEGPRLHSHL